MKAGSAELTIVGESEEFPEVMGDVLLFEVVKAEHFDAWGIDDGAAEVEGKHFCEGGGVGAFAAVIGEVAGAKVEMGLNMVNEG